MKLKVSQLRRIIKEEVKKIVEGAEVTLSDVDAAFDDLVNNPGYMADASEPGTVGIDDLLGQIESNTGVYLHDLHKIQGFRQRYETYSDDSVKRKTSR